MEESNDGSKAGNNFAGATTKPPTTPKPLIQKPPSLTQVLEKVEHLESQIRSLQAESDKKDILIQKMDDRIIQLQLDQMRTASYLIVKEHTSQHLQNRIIQLEQYTRRHSLILKGIPKSGVRGTPEEEGEKLKTEVSKIVESSGEASFDDVDKFHRNGPTYEGEQDVIVRFKTHAAKESFFNTRKTLPDKRIKVQPSLSPATRSLLKEAKDALEKYYINDENLDNPPEFVYANLHGELLVKMKKKMKFGSFLRFNSLEELHNQIKKQNEGANDIAMREFENEMRKIATRVSPFVDPDA